MVSWKSGKIGIKNADATYQEEIIFKHTSTTSWKIRGEYKTFTKTKKKNYIFITYQFQT